MSDITCLECIVDDNDIDYAISILFQEVSFGWEEEELSSGKTLFRVYCPEPVLVKNVSQAFEKNLPNVVIESKHIPNQDWMFAWRDFFTPVHAGCFTVIPPWLLEDVNNKDILIVIEPKCAFGTGHHATTALCLEAIGGLVNKGKLIPGMHFFDLGTGSGILGIACAKIGLTGIGVDIDPIAIANAEENITINTVVDSVLIREGSIELGQGKLFNLIIANITAEPLKELSVKIINCITPGGMLILSGLLDSQAEDVKDTYRSLGKPHQYISGEWVALVWDNFL